MRRGGIAKNYSNACGCPPTVGSRTDRTRPCRAPREAAFSRNGERVCSDAVATSEVEPGIMEAVACRGSGVAPRRDTPAALCLPSAISACLFDLDGVLTDSASIHAAAWKKTFDEFLRARAENEGAQFVPFDSVRDYGEYVDGKNRFDGVRSFLASRRIELPEG